MTVRRIALLLDFDNIALGLPSGKRFEAKKVLSRVLDLGKVVIKRAYADWSRFDKDKTRLHELGFDLLEIPRRAMTGKNSADIRMVVDAMEVVISKEHIDTFALVTGDSDFTPLVAKLREHDKRVVGIGVKASTSKLLIDSCDEFIFYDEIERDRAQVSPEALKIPVTKASKAKDGAEPKVDDRKRAEGLYLVVDGARALLREYDQVWASQVKQTIARKHPAFSESYHGYPTFSALVADAVTLGLLTATRDEKSGNHRITGLGPKAQALLGAAEAGDTKSSAEAKNA